MSPDHWVLFDGDCSLCRTLATLLARSAPSSLSFSPWQTFVTDATLSRGLSAELKERPADVLRVWDGQVLLEGRAAWAMLIAKTPSLKSLGWLAQRLGLEDQTATIVMKTAGALKRFCARCGKRI